MFDSSPRRRRGGQRQRVGCDAFVLRHEALEQRLPLAVTSATLETLNGEKALVIKANNLPTNVEVSVVGETVIVNDIGARRTWPAFPIAAVKVIEFQGGAAADTFTTRNCWIPTQLFGNGGDDSLTGGFNGDRIFGGPGRDTLNGSEGADYLNGGADADTLTGGNGADTIIAIDGSAASSVSLHPGRDVVRGASRRDRDVVWIDTIWVRRSAGIVPLPNFANGDEISREAGDDTISEFTGLVRVSSFANGADRSLDGDRIADPVMSNGTKTYPARNFRSAPLFPTSVDPVWADGGRGLPFGANVVQGDLGNCALPASLSALLYVRGYDNPYGVTADAIRRSVVDFGDGTYGVKLGASVYRVDADLPDFFGTPAFARGVAFDGSLCLWPAIIEKGFATQFGNYARVASIGSTTVYSALGLESQYIYQHGRGIQALRGTLKTYFDLGQFRPAMTLELFGLNGAKKSGHGYSVVSQLGDDLLLRNPWGTDGDLVTADGLGNPNDGMIRITLAEVVRRQGNLAMGKLRPGWV